MDQSKVETVARRVREMIHSGVLAEGAPLPSTRALAAELGIARGTVVAAYEQLDGEGYLRTRHGAVARVAASVAPAEMAAPGRGVPYPLAGHDGPSQQQQQQQPQPHASASATIGATTPAVGGSPSTSPTAASTREAAPSRPTPPAASPPPIDATPGIPAVTAISARDWRAAWRAAADLPLRNEASDAVGTTLLRTQIAAQLALSRGFAPDVERVIVTAGTSDAISLVTEALRTMLGRAPRVAVEDPGYPGGRAAVESAGGILVPIAVGGEGIDLSALRTAGSLDAVMVTPTHQYPLGSTMPVGRRLELLEWAAAQGVVVIEDDYDSEFRHRGSPVPALVALDARGTVVHLGGFSKILDPRLRCAYLVTPASAVAEAVRAARTARGPAVAEPVQAALAHLMRTGALRRHLGRVRRDYVHKRERIIARVAEAAVPELEAAALSGGLHVVLTWPARPHARPHAAGVVARLADRGIHVADLAAYRVGRRPGDREGVVIGYGAVTPAELDRVLDALLAELG